MNQDIILEVAGIAWEKNREELGVIGTRLSVTLKPWEEVKRAAAEGDNFQKVMMEGHVKMVQQALDSYLIFLNKKKAVSMENTVDDTTIQAYTNITETKSE